MFYYVNGTVAETGPNLAVIDCGGVGYACATTNYTLSQLKKGERAKLYTYLHVREEIFELYGFSSQAELNSFRMLIGVSGVGPKAALAVLSATTPQNLALSIVTGDEKALTAAPAHHSGAEGQAGQGSEQLLRPEQRRDSRGPSRRQGRRGRRRVGGAGLRLSGDRPGPEGHRHGRPAPGGDHPSGSEKNGAVRRRMHEH